jgi:hypothetical protein
MTDEIQCDYGIDFQMFIFFLSMSFDLIDIFIYLKLRLI